jgi:uncharacterized protein
MNITWKIIIPIFVMTLIIVPLSAYSAVNDTNLTGNSSNSSILDNNNLSQNNTTLLNVPNVIEPNNYSSGPASLQAVLSYYGMDMNADELINMTNCTVNGTAPGNIANVATNLGFSATVKQNMTLKDLQQYMIQGTPIIVDAQAWKNNSTNQNWTDDQNNSHYMVVIGIDNQNVYFEDPTVIGSRGYISNQEFLDRWHATYQEINGTNVTTNQLGIIISGKTAPSRPLLLQIS